MATTVTVTCDRCGSIIPESGGEGRRLIGMVSVTLERSYESLQRSEWQLCASCLEHTAESIGDIAGVPSTDWRRQEPGPEVGTTTDDLATRIASKVADRLGQPTLKASAPIAHDASGVDAIEEARRVLEGDGPEGDNELPAWQQASF